MSKIVSLRHRNLTLKVMSKPRTPILTLTLMDHGNPVMDQVVQMVGQVTNVDVAWNPFLASPRMDMRLSFNVTTLNQLK